jgi:hypothetical protein
MGRRPPMPSPSSAHPHEALTLRQQEILDFTLTRAGCRRGCPRSARWRRAVRCWRWRISGANCRLRQSRVGRGELIAEDSDYAPIVVDGPLTIEGLVVGLVRGGRPLDPPRGLFYGDVLKSRRWWDGAELKLTP